MQNMDVSAWERDVVVQSGPVTTSPVFTINTYKIKQHMKKYMIKQCVTTDADDKIVVYYSINGIKFDICSLNGKLRHIDGWHVTEVENTYVVKAMVDSVWYVDTVSAGEQ
jgi:hypothetical protein